MYDILVVGAGPAGLLAAEEAARAGASVLVIEEDAEVGRPDHCAGLLSRKGLERLAGDATFFIESEIRGARFFTPSGRSYEVRSDSVKAVVVDRPRFDLEMLRRAEKAGAEVETRRAFAPGIGYRVLVDAEGVKGRVARRVGLGVPRSIPAVQVDVEGGDFEGDMVEIHMGEWAPGFIAWAVPRRDRTRIGLAAYSGLPLSHLEKLLRSRNFEGRVSNARVSGPIYGKVVVGGPLEEAVSGNAVAVGDAGGFVKPTTGGGVILGGLTAQLAGRAAAEAALRGSPLGRFNSDWRRLYGRDFWLMKMAARVFGRMRGGEIDRIMEAASSGGMLNILMGYDLDLQGGALGRVFKSRMTRHLLCPMIRSLFA